MPPDVELPPFVWAQRADEVWTWDGAAWVFHCLRADLDPEATATCDARGHCELTALTDVHSICDDCHEIGHGTPIDAAAEWERLQWTWVATPIDRERA